MGEALLAPSGDYVLLAPSGDYNQSIPPKSTNRIRCFTSRTVLLPTSAKLTRGIWEINREEILVLTVTVFKNIQEHSMKFKNIRGYSNGKIKFKNIQDFRRPVRTLSGSETIRVSCRRKQQHRSGTSSVILIIVSGQRFYVCVDDLLETEPTDMQRKVSY